MVRKTNNERMTVLETKMSSIEKKLDQHISEQRADFIRMFDKLDELGDRFAGKWVEKLAIGLTIGLITAILAIIIH